MDMLACDAWNLSVISCLVFAIWLIWCFRYHQKIPDINNRHVFITGCDSGFGRLLTERLDRKQVTVYAGCLLNSSVEELKNKCSSRVIPIQLDVTDSKSVLNAACFVENELSGRALWAIVNNAGISTYNGPFEWTSKEDCQRVLDVNLLGAYDATVKFLPLLKRGKEGRIVNMSSYTGRISLYPGGYTLSKYGMEAFSDFLSYDMLPYNITIHTLEPGNFRTNLSAPEYLCGSLQKTWDKLDPNVREKYGGEEYLDEHRRNLEASLKFTSPDIGQVVDAYEHALLSKYPKNRYVVGRDAKYFFVPLSWFPFTIQMFVISLLSRVTGIRVPIPRDAVKKY